jgi:hypothetical protein
LTSVILYVRVLLICAVVLLSKKHKETVAGEQQGNNAGKQQGNNAGEQQGINAGTERVQT